VPGVPNPVPPADADTIRRAASEVLAGPGFRLDRGGGDPERSLLMELLLRVLAAIVDAFRFLQGLPIVLRLAVAAVLVAILAFIVWQIVVSILGLFGSRRAPLPTGRARAEPVRPEDLEAAADDAARAGDLVTAVRRLFLAALRRIEIASKPLPRGLTDREVLARTARSPLHAPLSGFVDTLERAWYGDRPCTPTDLESCREHHRRIVDLLASGAGGGFADGRVRPRSVTPLAAENRTEATADALSP